MLPKAVSLKSPKDQLVGPSASSVPSLAVRLLGGAAIEEAGTPLSGRATHRHALALLAFLAASPGRSASRDKLVACLWPEAAPDSVRHRLNVALYDLRKALGKQAIVSAGDDLRLDASAVWVDVVRFEEAVARGDMDEAIALYRGAFLDGFYIPESLEFEQWTESERERIARAFGRALEKRAREAEKRGDFAAAARSWRRLAEQDPYGSRAVVGLMRSLEAAGERGEALRVAERHARILAQELGAAPDPAVVALARRLRSGDGTSLPEPAILAPVGAAEDPVKEEPEAPAPAAPTQLPGARRLRRVATAGTVAVALAIAALPWVTPEGSTADEIVPDRAVVLPFVVRGDEEFDYLGEGMAEILGTTLDGVGTLRTVDAHAVLGFIRRSDLDPADPAVGRTVAEHFGAGRFVIGSIVESGRRLHVQATLYRTDGTIEARVAAGAGGDEEFFQMVDVLTRRLLIPSFDPREERLTRLAVTTSSSLAALKAYLQGEGRLRAGEYEAAAEGFRRAVREDSTFALAWYRLAVAAEWSFQPHDAAVAVERALRLADRLPERDRLLLVGWDAYARGEADRAEAVYLRILDDRPDEMEAWLQLGEIRFHYAPSRRRTIADSRSAFERVLDLEPSHEGARIHLARVAAHERDLATLDSHLQWLLANHPGGQATLEARGLRAFAARDAPAARRLAQDLRGKDSYMALGVLLGQFHVGHVDGMEWAAALLTDARRPVEVRTAGHAILALVRLSTGRLAEAREAIVAAESLDPLRGGELRALVASLPFLPSDPAALAAAQEALERGEAAAHDESFFLPDHEAVRPLLRPYLRGLLSAALGEREEALRRAAEIERMSSPAADPTLARDLALGVRAEVLRREGRAREALQALEQVREPPGYELVLPSPFQPRARERYLRALLLDEQGRDEAALAAYTATGSRSLYDLPYRAPIQLRLGALHDRAGDRPRAAEAYARFFALWRRADAELQPQVASARARITAATARTGTEGEASR